MPTERAEGKTYAVSRTIMFPDRKHWEHGRVSKRGKLHPRSEKQYQLHVMDVKRKNGIVERRKEIESQTAALQEKFPEQFIDQYGYRDRFVDPSDIQFNFKSQIIEFAHVPTGNSISFKAYLTDFKDNYESNWEAVEVYGRMDDIQMFKGTKRKIDISWQVVAGSMDEALSNLQACADLFKFLYPTYESGSPSSTLKAPPLLKLKFANLVQSSHATSISPTSAMQSGLLGVSNGFSFTPNLDAGFFDPGTGILLPKVLELSCTFSVLHTEATYWDAGNNQWSGSTNYPNIPGGNYTVEQTDAGIAKAQREAEFTAAAEAIVTMKGEQQLAINAPNVAAAAIANRFGSAEGSAAFSKGPVMSEENLAKIGAASPHSRDFDGGGLGTRGTGPGSGGPSLGIGGLGGETLEEMKNFRVDLGEHTMHKDTFKALTLLKHGFYYAVDENGNLVKRTGSITPD